MPSTKISPSHAFLLLLASIAFAQDQPADPSPTSPPFPLDSNGEAHFNIPVVIKLADVNAAAATVPGVPVHRRNPDSNTAEDGESPQPIAAFDDSAAKIVLAQPAHVEPAFEVAHQGQDHDNSAAVADLEARNAPYNPAGAAMAGAGTHTVLIVETTGTVVSTLTEPCSDSSSPTVTVAVSPPPPGPPAGAAPAGNTTTTTTATSTIHETVGLPPKPPGSLANHTSYPLRNGKNSTRPGNSTGGGVKPHATGFGMGGAKPSGQPVNPANGPSSRLTGGAEGVWKGKGRWWGWVVAGWGALVVAMVV